MSKLKTSQSWSRPFQKAVIEFYKLPLNGNTKKTCLFFKRCWILAYFWNSNLYNLGYILEKCCKSTLFGKPPEVSHGLRNDGPFEKWENLVFFGWLFLQNNNCWHSEFLVSQIFDKGLSCLENGGVGVNYCWNYWPSELLLHFIEYCLDQLNNNHTKTTVN